MLLSQLVWDASARRDSRGTVGYCDEAISHAREIGDQVAAAKAETDPPNDPTWLNLMRSSGLTDRVERVA